MDTVNEKNAGRLSPEDHPGWTLDGQDDLVAETVAIYAAARIDDVEGRLPQTLERIGTFFRGDRCYACEVDESCKMIINRIEWCGPILTPSDTTANDLPVALSNQHLSRLQRGETVHLAGPSEPGATTLHNSLSGGAFIRSSWYADDQGRDDGRNSGVDIATEEMRPSREEVDVLRTLAGIIALGWGCARSEKKRRLFQIAVSRSRARLDHQQRRTIEYVNPALERITGYARGEPIGGNPRILKSGLQKPVFYQKLWSTISKGEPWQGCFINRRKSETHYSAEAVIIPVTDGTGSIRNYVGIKCDVTQENHLQRQLIQFRKRKRSGPWPAASPMTSTTSSPLFWEMPNWPCTKCRKAAPAATTWPRSSRPATWQGPRQANPDLQPQNGEGFTPQSISPPSSKKPSNFCEPLTIDHRYTHPHLGRKRPRAVHPHDDSADFDEPVHQCRPGDERRRW